MNLSNYLTKKYDTSKVVDLISDNYHENFGFQWKIFSKLQLDSFNGSSESRDRLIAQSGLELSSLKGKDILEIGSGNGRFTEILLEAGANVISVDYSSAIEANFDNHSKFVENHQLICIRADLFDLPIKENSFDIVFCYGVIQHTGDNEKALATISKYVKTEGLLLIDIYSNSLKHFNPWIYLIRPFFSLFHDNEKKLNFVKRFVDFLFPFQLFILKLLHKKGGLLKILRWIVNRSPNSVYGINLYLDKKISLQHAREWSYCDTFDAWVPKHDIPVSNAKWLRLLEGLDDYVIERVVDCGQGWSANLIKKTEVL